MPRDQPGGLMLERRGGESPPELSGMGPAKKEREREFAEAGFLAAAGSFDPDDRRPGPGLRSLSSLSRDGLAHGKTSLERPKRENVKSSTFQEI